MCKIIVTDGMDNDGRVAGLIAEKLGYFEKIYLSRGRKFMSAPVWVDDKFSESDLDLSIFKGANVIFTDICLSLEEMDYIASIAKSLQVFDHHKVDSAFRDREYMKWSNFGDKPKSAALLIAEFARKEGVDLSTNLPELISDRDTFTKKWIESEYIFMALNEFKDVRVRLALNSQKALDSILERGKDLFEEHQKTVKETVKKVQVISWQGQKVGYIENLPFNLVSDVGNMACKELDIDFFVNVSPDRNDAKKLNFGLRSLNGQALPIAKRFGGGGHSNACGFQLDYNPFTKMK